MRLVERAIYEYHKLRFNQLAKSIRQTRALKYEVDPKVTIVSMIGSQSLDMYLISLKSFMRNLGHGSIEAINDGSLTAEDRKVLEYHVPGIHISEASDVDTGTCPTYISWKRLCRVVELVKTSYVVQLDSDIVTMNPLHDIHSKIENNEGFLIGCWRWPPVSTKFLKRIVDQWTSSHVQPTVERELYDIEYFSSGTNYIRGCAGFCGYTKDCITFEQLQALSGQIEAKVGRDKWSQWGSEQTATNCVISKSAGASVLPWPKYQNFMFPLTNEPQESAVLTHFIGSNRFKNATYRKLAKQVIQDHR
jgi:hypothetical protein